MCGFGKGACSGAETPLEHDVFTGGQILTYEFRDLLKKGEVQAVKASIEKYTETGVHLNNGADIEADMVVYGTGFAKNYDVRSCAPRRARVCAAV